VRNRLKLNR